MAHFEPEIVEEYGIFSVRKNPAGGYSLFHYDNRIATVIHGDWKAKHKSIDNWINKICKAQEVRLKKIKETISNLEEEYESRFKIYLNAKVLLNREKSN